MGKLVTALRYRCWLRVSPTIVVDLGCFSMVGDDALLQQVEEEFRLVLREFHAEEFVCLGFGVKENGRGRLWWFLGWGVRRLKGDRGSYACGRKATSVWVSFRRSRQLLWL